MAQDLARTYEGRIPIAIRCGECRRLRLDGIGSLLGVAWRGVNLESFEVNWCWAPMIEPRSAKSMLSHRPGPISFRLNDVDSADQPRVAGACKNSTHPAYLVPRLRLSSIAEAAYKRGWQYAHLGTDFARPRATDVQQGMQEQVSAQSIGL